MAWNNELEKTAENSVCGRFVSFPDEDVERFVEGEVKYSTEWKTINEFC